MSSASKDDDGVMNTEVGISTINVGGGGGTRTPLATSSPSTTNFQSSSASPTILAHKHHHHHQHQPQTSSPDLPAPKPAKIQDENQTPLTAPSPRPSTHHHNSIPLPNPSSTALKPTASIPRIGSFKGKIKSGSVKRLPSLHEIGMVYAENGGMLSGGGKPNISVNMDNQPPKPHLHRLITSSSSPAPSSRTTTTTTTSTSTTLKPTYPSKDLIINPLSPYTTSPVDKDPGELMGPGVGSPSTRLRLPLSALNRVGVGLGSIQLSSTSKRTGDDKEEGRQQGEEEGRTIGHPERQTIEVVSRQTGTNPLVISGISSGGVTPGGMISSISTALTEPTPVLITPAEGGGPLGADGGKGETVEGEELGGLSGLYGGDGRDAGLSGSDGIGGSMGKKTRWGPTIGSTQARQNNVNDDEQGKVKIDDKVLPLQHRWTLYYDTGKPLTGQDKVNSFSGTTLSMIPHPRDMPTKTKNAIEKEFEGRLLILGEFNTVHDFGKTFGQTFDLKRNHPSKMALGHNLHLFKDGIRPGGRWTLILQNHPGMLDRVWQNLVCALIGETIDPEDEICGAVISIRPKVERIQVWVRNKDNWDKVEQIGHGLLQGLDIAGPNSVASLEFAGNTGQPASPRPHLAIGKGTKPGPKLAQPRGPPGLPLSRAPSFAGSAPNSRRNSPTQSGFLNPFAGPLGIAQQPSSPRPSSLRPSASVSRDDQK